MSVAQWNEGKEEWGTHEFHRWLSGAAVGGRG